MTICGLFFKFLKRNTLILFIASLWIFYQMKIQSVINMLSEDLISRVGLILLSVVLAIRCGRLKGSLEESKKNEVLLKQNIAQERVIHDERIMKLQDYVDELIELNKKLEKVEEK